MLSMSISEGEENVLRNNVGPHILIFLLEKISVEFVVHDANIRQTVLNFDGRHPNVFHKLLIKENRV